MNCLCFCCLNVFAPLLFFYCTFFATLNRTFFSRISNANLTQVDPFLISSSSVFVEKIPQTEWLLFSYNYSKLTKTEFEDVKSNQTVLFYIPGGNVEYIAYAPNIFKMVEEMKGKLFAVLFKVPFRLAIFSPFIPYFGLNFFKDLEKDYFSKNGLNNFNIENYFLSGHSLGGVTASFYPYLFVDEKNENIPKFKGILFHASYQAVSLKDFNGINLMYLYGSEDVRLEPNKNFFDSKWQETMSPPNTNNSTQIFEIMGANHAQFGFYGEQENDGKATMGIWEQSQIIVQKSVEWIRNRIY